MICVHDMVTERAHKDDDIQTCSWCMNAAEWVCVSIMTKVLLLELLTRMDQSRDDPVLHVS